MFDNWCRISRLLKDKSQTEVFHSINIFISFLLHEVLYGHHCPKCVNATGIRTFTMKLWYVFFVVIV